MAKNLGKTIFIGLFLFLQNTALIYSEKNYPQKIISLAPSITKGLYLLQVEEKLIANTMYCISPRQATEKEKIGTVVTPNIERIFSLKPDLVLATPLTTPKTIKKLKDLGIRVVIFPTPRNFEDLCKQFLELGRLVGREKEAERIIEDVKEKVALIKKKVENLPRPKVLIQIGARPLFVATGRYFVNDYIEFAGGINIAKDRKEGIYSREEVLKSNPDVIIITTMGIVAEEEKKVWLKYKTLNAVKNGRIYIIEADKLTSPTPEVFVNTLEELVDIFHSQKIR